MMLAGSNLIANDWLKAAGARPTTDASIRLPRAIFRKIDFMVFSFLTVFLTSQK